MSGCRWLGLRVPALAGAVLAGLCVGQLGAQGPESWNDARVLDLVDRARAVRQSVAVDPDFRSYQADARGYVYFFIDRPDSDERTLVKADQIALDVYWQAPNLARQRIVGLRDEKVLPTNIRYHLDHLTVVQDDFGDFIRLGDGDEVEQVLHPVGPGSEEHYDFLLTDSLTISYGGGAEEVRVYEVRVRPRVYERPGFIGSVYLDRATSAIVRMSFTFTPASYVDPYLDYIRISLDNSLWDGKYWLPYRQEAELRRELPALDFLAGSIIQGRFEVGPYDFNVELPPTVILSRNVSAAPEAERRSFPFERGLFDDIEAEGLNARPSLDAIRSQAEQMLRERHLSGLNPLRLYLGRASDALRYNRAEGVFVGAGFALRPAGDVVVRSTGGYAIAREKLSGSVAVSGGVGRVVPELRGYWAELRDIGQKPGATGLVNTVGYLLGAQDYTDPYFARGVGLTLTGRGRNSPRVTLRMERHESARDVVSDVPGVDARPVRSVTEGTVGAVDLDYPFAIPFEGEASLEATLGRMGEGTFQSVEARAQWLIGYLNDGWQVRLQAAAGLVTNDAPAQNLFFVGGRETLAGHPYRAFVGDRYWLVHAAATHPLWSPWLSVRGLATVGAAYLDDRPLPGDWLRRDSDGIRASVGVGLAALWDVLRLDVRRGLSEGQWELVFSVAPRFRDWL